MPTPADALQWRTSRSWRRLALGALALGPEGSLADAARAAVLVARTLVLRDEASWDALDPRLPGRLARLGQAVAASLRPSPWAVFERLEPVLGADLLCEVLRQRFPRPPPGFARLGRRVGVRRDRPSPTPVSEPRP